MEIKVKMLDPSQIVVTEEVVNLPIVSKINPNDEPSKRNTYLIELNDLTININCKGEITAVKFTQPT